MSEQMPPSDESPPEPQPLNKLPYKPELWGANPWHEAYPLESWSLEWAVRLAALAAAMTPPPSVALTETSEDQK